MLDSQNLGLATLFLQLSDGDTAITGYSCYSGIKRHNIWILNIANCYLHIFSSRRHPSEFGVGVHADPSTECALCHFAYKYEGNSTFMQNQF